MQPFCSIEKISTFAPLLENRATQRELSSAGSEHLPYKQRVGGSNPSAPTKKKYKHKCFHGITYKSKLRLPIDDDSRAFLCPNHTHHTRSRCCLCRLIKVVPKFLSPFYRLI